MKTHLSLPTSDLAKSVWFYATLLDAKPAKRFDDYALFIAEQPGLELALAVAQYVSPTPDTHYGIVVESAAAVETAIERLERAGLVSSIERDETCCYARQTKVWTVDPDGRPWEVYTVHEDTDERDVRDATCCSEDSGSCCAQAPT
jgi:catechol 2,3-dioxygenase-like lactoylglutathione lyase family enzyme